MTLIKRAFIAALFIFGYSVLQSITAPNGERATDDGDCATMEGEE